MRKLSRILVIKLKLVPNSIVAQLSPSVSNRDILSLNPLLPRLLNDKKKKIIIEACIPKVAL